MNSSTLYSIVEYQIVSKQDFIHEADFAWLISNVELGSLPCFHLKVQAGQIVLVARHYLTIIRLPSGMVLEILPKISQNCTTSVTRQWVKNMLMDIHGIHKKPLANIAGADHAVLSADQTWLALCIDMWFDILPLVSLPRQYQQHQHNHPQAQGKLLIKQQLQHNQHRPHYRYTTQQQLSSNPLWHQFFYTTIIRLKVLGFHIPTKVQQAVQLTKPLPVHSYATSYQELQRLLSSNPNPQLSQALSLAWLILQLHDVTLDIDQANMPAMMIDMNQAFEQWVTCKLKQHERLVAENWQLMAQNQQPWLIGDDGTQRYLRPDILIHDDNGVGVVADIKYKYLDTVGDISSHDLYQVCVYQHHWQARQAWLIYPKTDSFNRCQRLQMSHTSQEMFIIPFDVEKGQLIF